MTYMARRVMVGVACVGGLVTHPWIVAAVLIGQTVIGCVTVLLLIYAVDRQDRKAVMEDLAGALKQIYGGRDGVRGRTGRGKQ